MKLKNKKVLVYGLSTSGKWVSNILIKRKATVFLYDDDLTKLRNKNLKNCYLIQELSENMIVDLDFLIVSSKSSLISFTKSKLLFNKYIL